MPPLLHCHHHLLLFPFGCHGSVLVAAPSTVLVRFMLLPSMLVPSTSCNLPPAGSSCSCPLGQDRTAQATCAVQQCRLMLAGQELFCGRLGGLGLWPAWLADHTDTAMGALQGGLCSESCSWL